MSQGHTASQGESEQVRGPIAVLRVRLHWRHGEWRLAKTVRIAAKVLPAGLVPEGAPPSGGLWFDVIDEGGGIVYRQRIREPLPLSAEVVDDKGAPRRVDTVWDEFFVDLLMPDDVSAVAVRLMARPNPFQKSPAETATEAHELAFVSFRQPPLDA